MGSCTGFYPPPICKCSVEEERCVNVSVVAFLLVFLAVCLFVSVAVLLVVACVAVWLSGWLAGWLGVLLPVGVQGCVFKLDEICPFQS